MSQLPSAFNFHGLDCRDLDLSQQAKLIASAVVPRPTALICTEGAAGLNAAPFSLFNIASVDPPMVMFSIGLTQYQRVGEPKDTLPIAGTFGLLTPAFGVSVYTVKSALDDPRITVRDIFAGNFPFVAMMMLILLVLIAFPTLSTALARM